MLIQIVCHSILKSFRTCSYPCILNKLTCLVKSHFMQTRIFAFICCHGNILVNFGEKMLLYHLFGHVVSKEIKFWNVWVKMKFGEFCNFMVAMATGQFIMIKKCRILTKYVIIYEHTHFQKNLRQGNICHLVNVVLC